MTTRSHRNLGGDGFWRAVSNYQAAGWELRLQKDGETITVSPAAVRQLVELFDYLRDNGQP